jgi:hypothetical protein
MPPRLGPRLVASPKQGHFDKSDEWKSYLPAVFAENCARAPPTKVAPYDSAKTFVALPSLVARRQQNQRIPILRMEEVHGRSSAWHVKEKVFPRANRKLNQTE